MESTYPHLLPAMSQYLFYAIGCLLAVILVPILGGVQNKEIVLWVLVGVSAFTALVGMLYRGKTKRRMHETLVLEGKKKEGEAESVGSVESDAKQGGGPEAADPKV